MKNLIKAFFVLFLGVFAPLAALVFELLTGQCAALFFDPIPTPAHAALIAVVPLSNFLLWRWLRRKHGEPQLIHVRLNALSIGVALYYAVMFLPLLPLGVVGLLVLIGLLPLSPLCSLSIALLLRRAMKRLARTHRRTLPRTWRVCAVGFAALLTL